MRITTVAAHDPLLQGKQCRFAAAIGDRGDQASDRVSADELALLRTTFCGAEMNTRW
jgi:hypothetical protein